MPKPLAFALSQSRRRSRRLLRRHRDNLPQPHLRPKAQPIETASDDRPVAAVSRDADSVAASEPLSAPVSTPPLEAQP